MTGPFRVLLTVAGCGVLAAGFAAGRATMPTPGTRSTTPDGVLTPPRRAADTPSLPAPALPGGGSAVRPLTLWVDIHRTAGAETSSTSQVITRTPTRVHVETGTGREWLFVRHPLDPSRVTATLVDHGSRSVVAYQESELRNLQGLRGWADVLTLGIDIDQLAGMGTLDQRKTIGGVTFTRLRPSAAPGPLADLWWNEAELLPSGFELSRSGVRTTVSVRRIEPGADENRLRPAQQRYPEYRVLDVADAGE